MKVNAKIILAGLITIVAFTQAQAMRWYSPSTARWLSPDPIEERGGKNLYLFVRNDAIKRIDPDGRDSCDPTIACCNAQKINDSFNKLEARWLHAVKFLEGHNVRLDPDDQTGVSCVESANRILNFMSPVPSCWKCYLQRRSWNYNPYGGDENSIRCDPVGSSSWRFFSMVFDWWYLRYEDYNFRSPIPLWLYKVTFPYELPAKNGWWTADNPAPHDDCITKSSWPYGPENYGMWLQPIVDKYGDNASN
jgi:hypothetical protein